MNARGRLAIVVAAVVAAVLIVLVVWAVVPTRAPAQGVGSLYPEVAAEPAATEPPPPSILEAALSPVPAPPSGLIAPVERIRIPAIEVDASIVEMNLTPQGALDVPNAAHLVAWYDFTGKPGMGGNAVMSGHVDYAGVGPAVFWDLAALLPGSRIQVALRDGNVINYEVLSLQSYPVADVPMAEVVAPTDHEILTLITCGGSFVAGHYTHRLVVRALRVDE